MIRKSSIANDDSQKNLMGHLRLRKPNELLAKKRKDG